MCHNVVRRIRAKGQATADRRASQAGKWETGGLSHRFRSHGRLDLVGLDRDVRHQVGVFGFPDHEIILQADADWLVVPLTMIYPNPTSPASSASGSVSSTLSGGVVYAVFA